MAVATEVWGPATERCPVTVDNPVMLHRWSDMAFLHWPYEPDEVQGLLPDGVTVDTCRGAAWVTLLPFHLEVWAPNKLVGTGFLETNVRTYVRGPDGVPGIVFLSLDAERLDSVLVARATYGLPYRRAVMGCEQVDGTRRYWCDRTWPGHHGIGMDATLEVGDRRTEHDTTELDRFLTSRFAFYSRRRGGLRRGWAQHPPWRLHHAEVTAIDEDMVEAVGLPTPAGAPELAHWSPGTDVAFGRTRRVQ